MASDTIEARAVRACGGSSKEATKKRRRASVIPIEWRTCPHCLKRYDEGNARAAFSHRNRECLGDDTHDREE
jgi:hypothetical protein